MSENVEKARLVAVFAHAGQKYSSDDNYVVHLENVVNTLKEFDLLSTEYLQAGWLHDVVEDTNVSIGLVQEYFGEKVAQLVYAVTNEVGNNRKTRNLKTYAKLASIPEAVPLKLCDRIANVRYALKTGHLRFYEMYKREYELFRSVLYLEGTNTRLWHILDLLMEYKGASESK